MIQQRSPTRAIFERPRGLGIKLMHKHFFSWDRRVVLGSLASKPAGCRRSWAWGKLRAGWQPAVPGLGGIKSRLAAGGPRPGSADFLVGQGQSPQGLGPPVSNRQGAISQSLGAPTSSSARGNLQFFYLHRLDCPWPTRTSALPGEENSTWAGRPGHDLPEFGRGF